MYILHPLPLLWIISYIWLMYYVVIWIFGLPPPSSMSTLFMDDPSLRKKNDIHIHVVKIIDVHLFLQVFRILMARAICCSYILSARRLYFSLTFNEKLILNFWKCTRVSNYIFLKVFVN